MIVSRPLVSIAELAAYLDFAFATSLAARRWSPSIHHIELCRTPRAKRRLCSPDDARLCTARTVAAEFRGG
jgi:hypothetical protein